MHNKRVPGGGPGGPNTAENLSGGRNTKFVGGGQNKNVRLLGNIHIELVYIIILSLKSTRGRLEPLHWRQKLWRRRRKFWRFSPSTS